MTSTTFNHPLLLPLSATLYSNNDVDNIRLSIDIAVVNDDRIVIMISTTFDHPLFLPLSATSATLHSIITATFDHLLLLPLSTTSATLHSNNDDNVRPCIVIAVVNDDSKVTQY